MNVSRQQKMLTAIEEYGHVSVGKLSKLFDVSQATIRKDLSALEIAQLVKRTHGGVILARPVTNGELTSFRRRSQQFLSEKRAVAHAAIQFIKDHDSIVLDASSTCVELGRLLVQTHFRVTVITNGLVVAQLLKQNPLIQVYIVGGALRDENSVEGTIGVGLFSRVHSTKCFLSSYGVDVNDGVTEFSVAERELKEYMLRQTKEHFLLVDHSKFDVQSVSQFAALSDFDYIITDQGLPPITLEKYQKNHPRVICAENASSTRSSLDSFPSTDSRSTDQPIDSC